MKHEIIKTENYHLVVDESEIKEGDWLYHSVHGIRLFNEQETKNFDSKTYSDKNWKKIIAHLPLNNSPILEGVDLLPPIEDDVEKLAMDKLISKWSHLYRFGYPKKPYPTNYENDLNIIMIGIYQDKEKCKYTEEDMIKAAKYGYEFRDTTSFPEHKFEDSCINNTKQWLQSLQQPKIPVAFESDIEDLKMLKNRAGGVTFFGKPKTTTNSQGLTQWVGEYRY